MARTWSLPAVRPPLFVDSKDTKVISLALGGKRFLEYHCLHDRLSVVQRARGKVISSVQVPLTHVVAMGAYSPPGTVFLVGAFLLAPGLGEEIYREQLRQSGREKKLKKRVKTTVRALDLLLAELVQDSSRVSDCMRSKIWALKLVQQCMTPARGLCVREPDLHAEFPRLLQWLGYMYSQRLQAPHTLGSSDFKQAKEFLKHFHTSVYSAWLAWSKEKQKREALLAELSDLRPQAVLNADKKLERMLVLGQVPLNIDVSDDWLVLMQRKTPWRGAAAGLVMHEGDARLLRPRSNGIWEPSLPDWIELCNALTNSAVPNALQQSLVHHKEAVEVTRAQALRCNRYAWYAAMLSVTVAVVALVIGFVVWLNADLGIVGEFLLHGLAALLMVSCCSLGFFRRFFAARIRGNHLRHLLMDTLFEELDQGWISDHLRPLGIDAVVADDPNLGEMVLVLLGVSSASHVATSPSIVGSLDQEDQKVTTSPQRRRSSSRSRGSRSRGSRSSRSSEIELSHDPKPVPQDNLHEAIDA